MSLSDEENPTVGGGPLRVGLLGCGQITRYMHDPVFTLPGVRDSIVVSAVYDPEPKAVKKYLKRRTAEGHPQPDVATSASALIERADVDAVAVLTPTSLHCELAEASLSHGKPVFVEKPLARSSIDARSLVAKADETALPVQVGMVLRHSKTVSKLEELIDTGELGRLLWMQWDEHRPMAPMPWRYERASEGDVILWDKAVHQFDLFAHIAESPISSVCGMAAQCLLPRPGEPAREIRSFNYRTKLSGEGYDDVMLTLAHQNGVRSSLHVSYVSPWGKESRWLLQFEEGKIAVYWEALPGTAGRPGTYTYVLVDQVSAPNPQAPWKVAAPYPPSQESLSGFEPNEDPLHHGSIAQWECFRDVVHGKRGNPCPLEEAVRAIEVAEASQRAIREGRTVEVGADDPTC